MGGYLYTRISNPTVDLLQDKIALLEDTKDAVATSSGMAAVASTVMGLVKPNENIVSCNAIYGGTFALFNNHLKHLGIGVCFISPTMSNDKSNIIPLIDENTRLLYIETPANPTLDIIDIKLWANSEKELKKAGISQGLIRLSVGLEHCDDIIEDLEWALSVI